MSVGLGESKSDARLGYARRAWLGLSGCRGRRCRRGRREHRRPSTTLCSSICAYADRTRPPGFLLCAGTRFSSRGRLVAGPIGGRAVAHLHRSEPLSLYLDRSLALLVCNGSPATYPAAPFFRDISSLHDAKARSMTPPRADIACD